MRREANFNRVARLYRWAEYAALGPLLQTVRTHFLPRLAERRKALLFGDGDGRFVARLLEAAPRLEATAVDGSSEMLRLLKERCDRTHGDAGRRLQTVCGDAREYVCGEDVDLVVTHFFLDCLHQKEVEELVRRVAGRVEAGTIWVLSDFRVPARGWMRPVAAAYVGALYLAFRVLTGLRVQRLPDPQEALRAGGFERMEAKQWMGGLLYAELWELRRAGRLAQPEGVAAHLSREAR